MRSDLVRDARQHDDRHAEDALDLEPIVPIRAREPVREPQQLAGEGAEPGRPFLLEQRGQGRVKSLRCHRFIVTLRCAAAVGSSLVSIGSKHIAALTREAAAFFYACGGALYGKL